jgi:hypothetical protein
MIYNRRTADWMAPEDEADLRRGKQDISHRDREDRKGLFTARKNKGTPSSGSRLVRWMIETLSQPSNYL